MRNILSIQRMAMLLAITTVFTFNLVAQYDAKYAKQIEAYKQCFIDKNGDKIKPYLSTDISFPPVPKDRLTPEVIDAVFADIFSAPGELKIKEYKAGEVVIQYDFGDFEGLGKRESSILFDNEGKITRIELIENIIREQREKRNSDEAGAVPQLDELSAKYPSKRVEFKTPNQATVVGDLYEVDMDAPVILLCHQFGWNKYEYADIAPKLNEMGFNALAVDLTGGGNFGKHNNETSDGRGEFDRGKLLDYAEEELATAIDYLKKRYNKKVTVWGSSYSATLVIFAAQKNKDVNASISFSGFNHFRDARPTLETILSELKKPLFMTSAKAESSIIEEILKDIKLQKNQYHFTPNGGGQHGAKGLWNGQDDAEEYWVEIRRFLTEVYPNR